MLGSAAELKPPPAPRASPESVKQQKGDLSLESLNTRLDLIERSQGDKVSVKKMVYNTTIKNLGKLVRSAGRTTPGDLVLQSNDFGSEPGVRSADEKPGSLVMPLFLGPSTIGIDLRFYRGDLFLSSRHCESKRHFHFRRGGGGIKKSSSMYELVYHQNSGLMTTIYCSPVESEILVIKRSEEIQRINSENKIKTITAQRREFILARELPANQKAASDHVINCDSGAAENKQNKTCSAVALASGVLRDGERKKVSRGKAWPAKRSIGRRRACSARQRARTTSR